MKQLTESPNMRRLPANGASKMDVNILPNNQKDIIVGHKQLNGNCHLEMKLNNLDTQKAIGLYLFLVSICNRHSILRIRT